MRISVIQAQHPNGSYHGIHGCEGVSESRPTPGGDESYHDSDAQIRFLGFTDSGHLDNLQYIGFVDEVVIFDRAINEQEAREHFSSSSRRGEDSNSRS